jgi:WW domain-containing oxidoreductase
VTNPSSQARDEKLQENVWKLCMTVLKEKLGDLPYSTA